MESKLFVIKQRGRNLFWNCSAEHGSGWNPESPKQSFSPSELVKEIRRLIDEKCFVGIEICQLVIQCDDGPQDCGSIPHSMQEKAIPRDRCPTCGRRV